MLAAFKGEIRSSWLTRGGGVGVEENNPEWVRDGDLGGCLDWAGIEPLHKLLISVLYLEED